MHKGVRVSCPRLWHPANLSLALIDKGGEIRCSLTAGQAADRDGVAMLMFARKGTPTEMASFIGAENDGSGTVSVRDSAGAWKEMS